MHTSPKRGSPIAAQTIDAARAARSVRRARLNAFTRAKIDAIQSAGVSTLDGIARELEKRGVRTPAGHTSWRRVQVSRMLAAIRAAEKRANRKIRDRELGR